MTLSPPQKLILSELIKSAKGNGNDFGFIEDGMEVAETRKQLDLAIYDFVRADLIEVHEPCNGWTQFTWPVEEEEREVHVAKLKAMIGDTLPATPVYQPKPFAVRIEVSEDDIADLLCCAFEEGIGYWAKIIDYVGPIGPKAPLDFPKYVKWPMTSDGAVVLESEEVNGATTHRLTREKLEKGLQLMADKQPEHFNNFVTERFDAETGDVFVQLALFGEVVFGRLLDQEKDYE